MPQLISVKNYAQTFGEKEVVHDLSFDVQQGEIFAFLGANGSGKTTTIRALLGIIPATRGELLIGGKRFSSKDSTMLGYLPEERGLYTSASVMETMRYFGELKGLAAAAIDRWAKNYLEHVGLSEKLHAKIKELSSGQQQKIQLGITIINEPQLLVLDEPTKGLDPVNRELLMQILLDLNKKGTTVVFITHQMEEVEEIADRLVMIKNGHRVLYGSVNEVRESFGRSAIHVEYAGELPTSGNLFTAKVLKNKAELVPKPGISSRQIFSYLASQNIDVKKFAVAAPSLQEIFVEVSRDANK